MSSLPLNLLKSASLIAIMGSLAACSGGGGSGGSGGGVVAGVPAPDRLAQLYGTGFATSFRMASTAPPTVPVAGDIVPLSLTTPPNALF